MTITPEKDYDRIASILVEAAYFGDKRTADRWEISTRTIQRYRDTLHNDNELSLIVEHKRELFETEWVGKVAPAIRAALDFIVRAAQDTDHTKPENIHAMAGALKIVAEVELTRRMLNARLHSIGYAIEDGNTIKSLPPDGETIEGEITVE